MRMSSATIPASSSSLLSAASRDRKQFRDQPALDDYYPPLELPLRWRNPPPFQHSNRAPPLSQTTATPPKSSTIHPAHTELPLPLCSRDLGSGVESKLLRPDSSSASASSRDRPADLHALQEIGPNTPAPLYAPVTDTFHHPTQRSFPDPTASDHGNMDDGSAPQTPIQPVNPLFRARAPEFSFPRALASSQISRSKPPACPESCITACSDFDDTEATSDQIRPHVISALVARSVPFPLLRGPLEPVSPCSIRGQDPMLKSVSNFDKSELDKLFVEMANATPCKSTVGGAGPSGDERFGYVVYSNPACRYPSYITGGIDECGYVYVPNIGGFSDGSSSPVSRWTTRTLSPTVDDFACQLISEKCEVQKEEWNAPKPRHASLLKGALNSEILNERKSELWASLAPQDWKPCIPSASSAGRPVKSSGFVLVFLVGGLNQQRIGICDAVAVKILNATRVIPHLEVNSVLKDSSSVEEIYDVDHFINVLKDEISIELPPEYAWSTRNCYDCAIALGSHLQKSSINASFVGSCFENFEILHGRTSAQTDYEEDANDSSISRESLKHLVCMQVMIGHQRRKVFDPGGLIIISISIFLPIKHLDGVELFDVRGE